MTVSSLVQWFGGNRMHAKRVGELIGKQDLIAVPFAGGMSEIPFLNARQILINDAHRLLINLCRVLTKNESELLERLRNFLFHPAELQDARFDLLDGKTDAIDLAAATFVNNWMCRCSGGTVSEMNQPIATRFTASGGSSIVRWKNAIAGLPEWGRLLRDRCECTCLHWRDFLAKWKDRNGHSVYLDPPWIGAGDEYIHKFELTDHVELAKWANGQKWTAIVIRHSDHPFYRDAYKESDGWEWFSIDKAKNQAGNATGEVLIRRMPHRSVETDPLAGLGL